MRANDFIEHVTFANEEIGAARGIEQRVGPFGVARIADDLSFELDAMGEAWTGLVIVTDVERRYRKLADPALCADRELAQLQFEGQLAFSWKCRGEQPVIQTRQTGRAGNCQRPRSLGDKLCVENEKWYATEMIKVKMRQQDEIDCVAVDPQSFHCDERRSTAVDQKISCGAVNMKTRVEPTA